MQNIFAQPGRKIASREMGARFSSILAIAACLAASSGTGFASELDISRAYCESINAHWAPGTSRSPGQCACNRGFTYNGSTCVSSGGGNRDNGGGYDYRAAAGRAQDLQDAQDKRDLEAAEQRARDDAVKAKFEHDKEVGLKELMGPTGTNLFSSELRGSKASGPSFRDIKTEKSERDLSGAHAAWKQLNCAASIANASLEKLQRKNGTDIEEFNNLTSEAIKALNGEPYGVECPTAPPRPKAYGREGSDEYKRKAEEYMRLLERGRRLAEQLRLVMEARREAIGRLLAHPTPQNRGNIEEFKQEKAKLDRFHENNPDAEKTAQNGICGSGAKSASAACIAALAAQKESLKQLSIGDLDRSEARLRQKLDNLGKVAGKIEAGEADAMALLDEAAKQGASPDAGVPSPPR